MEITYRTALEIAWHEGFVRQAYRDSQNVWTWSVGLTKATGHDVTRYIGQAQTVEHCLAVYVWALNNYADAVRAEFAGFPLSEAEFAGALSFHWNTGAIRSASWPDLWKAGEIKEARASFLSWKKPPAIVPRRRYEATLFFEGEWAADGKIPEYTRVKPDGTPDWGSRKLTDISDELRALLTPPVVIPTPAEPIASTAEGKLAEIAAILARP